MCQYKRSCDHTASPEWPLCFFHSVLHGTKNSKEDWITMLYSDNTNASRDKTKTWNGFVQEESAYTPYTCYKSKGAVQK